MRHDEYDDLIASHFDGELTKEQADQLQRWLAEDAAHLRRFMLAAQLHTDLHDLSSGIAIAKVQQGARRIQVRRIARYVLPLAASLLLLITGYYWLNRFRGEAFLKVAEGNITIIRGGRDIELISNSNLLSGDRVQVGAESIATIGYRGETTEVTLDAGSELLIDRSRAGGKRIELISGGVRASVSPQPLARPMMVRTLTADAIVLGTRFEIKTSKEATRLQVEHGRVQISEADLPDSAKLVSQYYSANVTDGNVLVEPAPMYLSSLIEDGLIAYWPMDEGEGKVLRDLSGNRRDGVIEGATWRSGHKNSGLAFRTKLSHVKTESVDIPSIFSIAVWVRVDERAERGQPVLSNTIDEGTSDGFRLMVNITKEGEPRAVFYSSDGSSVCKTTSYPGLLSTAKWHHVVAVVDQVARVTTVYVDGKKASNTTPLCPNFKSFGPLRIGQFGMGVTGPPDRSLDELRIYSRALSIDEVKLLANHQANAVE